MHPAEYFFIAQKLSLSLGPVARLQPVLRRRILQP